MLMKKFTLIISCICLSLALSAQITVTANDVQNVYELDNAYTEHVYAPLLDIFSIDIGELGGGNTWDFSSLQSDLQRSVLTVDPSTSPYTSDFDTADICLQINYTLLVDFEQFSYFSTDNGLDELGNGESVVGSSDVETTVHDPYDRIFPVPLTFETSWTESYNTTVTDSDAGVIADVDITSESVVDAYGVMTLPGGGTYEALRIRVEKDIDGVPDKDFIFIARNGARVVLSPESAASENTGTVSMELSMYVDSIADPGSTTGIFIPESKKADPNQLSNYPNPFNSVTQIAYQLPHTGHVVLELYDLTGRKLETLVNQDQPAGNYELTFHRDQLPEGVYLARLKVDGLESTIRMQISD
jgi:hypothetical protein